ncbi:hypothetical protein QE364_002626 [Nocardioides zeae]|uniref:Fibronectin type-III domain-containing protein n=2 Tax=Nocardioides zeae TaxID=1457234 RepID=A0AAJ1TZE1_9ACTN|nr:fibronectin type III domain-containing protein [Nocardioides zeae]MDQ1102723.1 hypothetical protein [Nocardioides zeae]MDR6173501.1 hypothetical protein [Nocardioides zeae]MDR6210907.1 hypothetical protein [Nocardioides zeae]
MSPFRLLVVVALVVAGCALPPAVGAAPGGAAGTAGPAAAVAATPASDPLALSSLPGAPRTVLLDVDGHEVRDTAWNTVHGLPAGAYAGLRPAAGWDPTTLELVRLVWLRVADDLAPFAVDVTTADPGAAALERSSAADGAYGMRVLLTTDTSAAPTLCDEPCGGIAFTDAFDRVGSADQSPAWVFVDPADLAAVRTDPGRLPALADTLAAAASHELGHTLGLGHDGDEEFEYHPGHGNWAPVMGRSEGVPLVQWSNGEYPGAVRREDDVALIAANGAPLRDDDHGDTPATGTVVATDAMTEGATEGVIGTRTDRDVLLVDTTCTGTIRARVAPSPGGNLDVGLRLLRPDGRVQEVAGTGTHGDGAVLGLDAQLVSGPVPAGRWAVEIDGVPVTTGTVADGSPTWSDYGSLGAWSARVSTACAGAVPPPVTDVRAAPPAPGVLQVRWGTASGTSPTAYEVRLWDGDHLVRGPETVSVGTSSATSEASARGGRHQLGGLRSAATYRVEVRSVAGGERGAWSSATGRTPPGAVTRLVASGARPTSVTLGWAPPTVGAGDVTGYVVAVDGRSRWVPADQRHLTLTGLRAGSSLAVEVRPTSAVGHGASASLTVRLPRATVPSAPTGISVRPGRPGRPTTAHVRWGAAHPNGAAITAYYVVARPASGSRTTKVSRVLGPAARSLDLPLPSGRWTVDVHAVNDRGTGPGKRSVPVLAQ